MSSFTNSESPESYDFWCAVWILSNVLGRKITVDRPMAPVFLNAYIILCAEAGITRKSSVVRAATKLVSEYSDRYDGSVGVFAGGLTSEKLDEHLSRQSALWPVSHIALSSSELVSLLGRERYAAGLPGKLTDLYDCPNRYYRSSITRGDTVSNNVYVTLLGASTPSWLIRAVNPDVVEGGFTSRCLFIVEDRPKRLVAWPEESIDGGTHEQLLVGLDGIRSNANWAYERAGGIRLTRLAKAAFTSWYEGRSLHTDAYGASFQAREDHHILRLAGILSASENAWEIDEHHLANATSAIMAAKHDGLSLFGTGIAASKTYALVDRIRQALVTSGRSGLSQSTVTALCRRFGSASDQQTVLTIMHELGLIQKFLLETNERGRPTTMFRATRALVNPKALEDVVEMLVPQENQ